MNDCSQLCSARKASRKTSPRQFIKDTEGNPFFIEEVIKSLIEQGQIYRVEGHWERKEISELAIPQSVKEAIGRRLDRQSQACMDMLHTAAALGKRFSFSELVAVSSTGEDELLDALDEASNAQLIRLESGRSLSVYPRQNP